MPLPISASGAPSFPNAQYIYPDPTNPSLEYSFEELRAMQRNLMDINWALRRREAEAKRNPPRKRPTSPPVFRDDITLSPPRAQTIAAKLQSPSPGKPRLKKKSNVMGRSEPTMTMHTRAATDEIYDILGQPIDQPSKDLDEEGDEDDGESDFFDDITTNTDAGGRGGGGSDSDSDSDDEGHGSGSGSRDDVDDDGKSDWSDDEKINYIEETVGLNNDTFYQKYNASREDEDDDEEDNSHSHSEIENEPGLPPLPPNMQPRKLFGEENSAGRKKPYMTPIVERTEVSLPPTTARKRAAEKAQAAKTPSRPKGGKLGQNSRTRDIDDILSSPFQEVVDKQAGLGYISGEESDFFLPPPRKLDLSGGAKAFEKIKSPPPVQAKTTVSSPQAVKGNVDENVGPPPKALLGVKKQPLASSAASTAASTAAATVKSDIAHKGGPLITDTQLNPMTPEIHATIISKLSPPLSAYDGYYEYPTTTTSKATEIRRSLKPPSTKASGGGCGGDKAVEVTFPGKPGVKGKPPQGQTTYIFQKQIGEGAFAPVYLVENTEIIAAEKEKDDGMEERFKDLALVSETRHLRRKAVEAVKMETDSPSAWEFYIMRQAHRRLGVSRASESILHALECHVYPKEASFLVLPYQSQGTVLDLVNLSNQELGAAKAQAGMDETLTMFLTVELLRTIEGLHSKGIIHGDLKSDNCLVRFEPVPEAEWDSRYRRDGSGGWSKKGIVLIDFGRGVDMKLFTGNVQFVADWKPDPNTDCVEMREARPWTYQIDYHGCAGIIHSMLFGKYLETVAEKGGGVGGMLGGGVIGTGGGRTWRVKDPFKRYWQGELWGKCFDVLLNPGKYVGEEEGGRLPVTKAVKGVREEMEKWLEVNAEKREGLKNVIRKMEGGLKARK